MSSIEPFKMTCGDGLPSIDLTAIRSDFAPYADMLNKALFAFVSAGVTPRVIVSPTIMYCLAKVEGMPIRASARGARLRLYTVIGFVTLEEGRSLARYEMRFEAPTR